MNKDYFFKRLTFKNPSFLQSYNYDFLPENFLAQDKIPIECVLHGLFYQKAFSHLLGTGCPVCGQIKSINARTLTTEEFITKSKLKFGDRFNYAKTKYEKENIPLVLTCSLHGDICVKPLVHLQHKFGCLQCSSVIPIEIKKHKLLSIARKIHENFYDYSHVKYETSSKPVEIVCPNHGVFWQNLYNHSMLMVKCPGCSIEKRKVTLSDFIEKSRKIHGSRYDYSKVVYESNASKVLITCLRHGDFVQRVASHLAGNKCKKCFIEESRLSTEEFIRNAKSIHGEIYDYSKVRYNGSKKPVEVGCLVHGSFWVLPNSHVSSAGGCRSCWESKGEKAVGLVLKKYGINSIREYRIKPYLYRFDFYLPEFNIFIEFNGEQHYRSVSLFGGKDAFRKTKERDEIKKNLVKQTQGNLIVLTYAHRYSGTVEEELIKGLKKLYRYWYVVGNSIKVFKTISEVCWFFGLTSDINQRNLKNIVEKSHQNVRSLF